MTSLQNPTNPDVIYCLKARDGHIRYATGLHWERDGFFLLYKRLEQGTYQWPKSEVEAKMLTLQQYRWLMEGLKIKRSQTRQVMAELGLA